MISKEDIEDLAKLARLQLSEQEKASLQKDVSNILEYVGHVAAVSSDSTGPTAPAHRNIMREDVVREEHDQLTGKEAAIRAAFPKEEKGYNVVRKIIQKDE